MSTVEKTRYIRPTSRYKSSGSYVRATMRCVTMNISVTVMFAAREVSLTMEMSELDYALNSQSEHKKIYAALEARDAMAARAEMEKHILRSMDDALTYYL